MNFQDTKNPDITGEWFHKNISSALPENCYEAFVNFYGQWETFTGSGDEEEYAIRLSLYFLGWKPGRLEQENSK